MYLRDVGNAELFDLYRSFSELFGYQSLYEWQCCSSDGEGAQQHKISSEHGVHKVLGQELEEAEEPNKHCTANDRKFEGVLHGNRTVCFMDLASACLTKCSLQQLHSQSKLDTDRTLLCESLVRN